MNKRLAAIAIALAALGATVAAAPSAAHAAETATTTRTEATSTTSDMTIMGWKYYGAYSTRARCEAVGRSLDYDLWTCHRDYRDGRYAYELRYYNPYDPTPW